MDTSAELESSPTAAPMPTDPSASRTCLEHIAPEIRQIIFRFCFFGSTFLLKDGPASNGFPGTSRHYSVLLVCKSFYQEGLPTYYQHVCVYVQVRREVTELAVSSNLARHARHINYPYISGWKQETHSFDPAFLKWVLIFENLHRVELGEHHISINEQTLKNVSDDAVLRKLSSTSDTKFGMAHALTVQLPDIQVNFITIVWVYHGTITGIAVSPIRWSKVHSKIGLLSTEFQHHHVAAGNNSHSCQDTLWKHVVTTTGRSLSRPR